MLPLTPENNTLPDYEGITLSDLPGLEGLRHTCERFGINFTAFGGLVRNLVLHRETVTRRQLPDLFTLQPFTSDIDLIHDGDESLTPKVLEAIYRDVPLADCFRWQLRSVASNAIFWEAMKVNNIVPANLLSLATNARGVKDDWNGTLDIFQNNYRYIRNGFYKTSPLFRAGRDLEFFSALLYFRVLLEADRAAAQADRERPPLTEQAGFTQAAEVINSASTTETVIALQKSDYLRARLLYLLKNLWAAASSRQTLGDLVAASGINSLLVHLTSHVSPFFWPLAFWHTDMLVPFTWWNSAAPRPITSSAHLGGDLFRLPHHFEGAWEMGREARESLEKVLGRIDRAGAPDVKVELGEGQEVLLASPQVQLNRGASASSRGRDGALREFIHFAIPLLNAETLDDYDAESLAAVIALNACKDDIPQKSFVFPVLSSCDVHPWQRNDTQRGKLLRLRANCWGVMEHAWRICGGDFEPRLQVFVLGAKWNEEARREAQSQP